jgi:CysZ protein
MLVGFKSFFEAIGFVSKNKMNYFYLFPIALSVLFFWVSFSFREELTGDLSNFIYQQFGIQKWINESNFWHKTIDGFITFLVWLATLLVWLKINRYVSLIILSPLFSIISEKTEQIATGRDYPFSFVQLLRDVKRGVFIAVRNLFLEFFILAVCFVTSLFFPPLAILTTPIEFLVSWYFMGFSFLDYNFERRKLSSWQSYHEVWKRAGTSISIGMLFSLLALIPIFGLAFGSVWATVAAALAINKEEKKGV